MPVSVLVATLVVNLLMVPSLAFYPFDPASWSLFFELIANVFHRLFYQRVAMARLWLITILCALAMGVLAEVRGTVHFGFDPHEFYLGLLRVTLSYTIGCMLLRVWRRIHLRWTLSPLIPGVVLLALVAMPILGQHTNATYDLVCLLVVFPILVLAGAMAHVQGNSLTVASALGTLSYPVYVLHEPCYFIFEQAWLHGFHARAEHSAAWSGFAMLLGVILLSFATEPFEMIVRRWMSKRLLGPPAQRPSQSPVA